jgi:hypothetical protein
VRTEPRRAPRHFINIWIERQTGYYVALATAREIVPVGALGTQFSGTDLIDDFSGSRIVDEAGI